MSDEKRSALCVGVSRHSDKSLADVPRASEGARELGKAMVKTGFNVRVITNPSSSMDLFEGLQKAIRDARDGALFLYFAGFLHERDGDLLLSVAESDVAAKRGWVPWSDVEDILKRERVRHALVIFNAEKVSGKPEPIGLKYPSVHAVGSVRARSTALSDANMDSYASAVIAAMDKNSTDLASYLTDGQLDSSGLVRYLAENAPKETPHATFKTTGAAPIMLRAFKEDVERVRPRSPSQVELPPPPAPEPEVEEKKPEPEPEPAPPPPPVEEKPEPEPEPEPPAPPVEEKKSDPEAETKPEPIKKKPAAPIEKPKPAPIEVSTPSRAPIYLLVVAVVAAIIYFVFLRH